jgi:hypothetical protein
MKVREVRAVICRLQRWYARHDHRETAEALRDLELVLQQYDDQTVAALVKRVKSNPGCANVERSERGRC